jgi:hypothetical protein
MTGDPAAAILLGQLLWWLTQARHPETVNRSGHTWLIKAHGSWQDECGLTPHQARSALKRLAERGLVEQHRWKHDGAPTTHLRACWDAIETAVTAQMDMPDRADGTDRSAESKDVRERAEPPLSETEKQEQETTTRGSAARLSDQPVSTVLSIMSNTFDETWAIYPRKLNRKGAEKAWATRVKAGANPADLYRATVNYAAIRAGEDPQHTMHGATFYGPNDRWADYLDPTEQAGGRPRPKETVGQSKARRGMERLAELERSNGRGLPA